MAYNGSEIRLSKSHFECIEKCPLSYKYKFIDSIKESKIAAEENGQSKENTFDYLGLYNIIDNCIIDFHKNLEYNKIKLKSEIDVSVIYDSLRRVSNIDDIDSAEEHIIQAKRMAENYFNALLPENIENITVKQFLNLNFKNYKLAVSINRIELSAEHVKLSFIKIGKQPAQNEYLKNDLRFITAALAAKQNTIYKNKKVCLSFLFLDTGAEIEFSPDSKELTLYERRIKEDIYNISVIENSVNKNKDIILISDDYIFRGNRLYSDQTVTPEKLAKVSGWCQYCGYYTVCAVWKQKPFELAVENYSDYSKRIKLSYSKYSGYKNCAYSWKRRYIDKMPSSPQPFFDLGHSVHETFEKFYCEYDKNARTLDYLMKIYNAVFPKFTDGYKDTEEYNRYFEKGKQMVINYYNKFVASVQFRPAHIVEAYFELPLGKNVSMNGYIDRIDKLEDDTFEILDYKTEPTDRTQEDIDTDDQLTIYFWATQRAFGMNTKQVSLFMLEFDKKITTSTVINRINELIEKIDATGGEMIEKINKYKSAEALPENKSASALEKLTLDIFPPMKNKYCRSCEFLDGCILKEEILNDASLKSMETL